MWERDEKSLEGQPRGARAAGVGLAAWTSGLLQGGRASCCLPPSCPLAAPSAGEGKGPGLWWHGSSPPNLLIHARCHCLPAHPPDRDVHRLVFPAVGPQHAGVYKSVIANKLGKAACYAHLYVTGKAGTFSVQLASAYTEA